MIFVDSNIPMYVIGEEHPNKEITLRLIESFARNNTRLVTNSETFQEILHRYSRLNRREAIQPAWDVLENLCDEIFNVSYEDVLEAKNVLFSYQGISSRDALHVAHLKRYKVSKIFSFDKGFDHVAEINRIPQ